MRDQLSDDSSPLLVAGQRILDAEFRDAAGARIVLEAIGAVVGHATFSAVVGQLGGQGKTTETEVSRALGPLEVKQILAIDTPVGSGTDTKLRRYRITDPYLRFWFRYCGPELAHIERGRADLALDRFTRDFPASPGWSTSAPGDRAHQHEFDVAAVTRRQEVTWLGTVKWRTGLPLNRGDLQALTPGRAVVARADGAKLLGACPSGAAPDADFDAVLNAGDVLAAYR